MRIALVKLLELHKSQGYLTIDDICSYVEKMSLPIDEVDRLCEKVLSAGIILLDEAPVIPHKNPTSSRRHYDRSRLNYNRIYDRVVKIDTSLAGYVEQLRQIPPPRLREESSLIEHAKEGNTFARERIITMYLKVALRIALWYHETYGLPLDEMIQEANVGLILALDKIQLDGHTRYSTYAPWWIRQNIERQAQCLSHTFYDLPVHLKQKLLIVIKLQRKHNECHSCNESELYCPALVSDICNELSIDTNTALSYLDMVSATLSIDEMEDELADLLNDNGQSIEDVNVKLQLEELLMQLTEREREVLTLRYGLYDGHQRTLDQVGSQLGVTRERVRQIEFKALERMRRRAYS
ncbi:MAG: sigma-70 family RNA polymerase sigma factor [Alicyclobacillus sp.]|nr:sigma-70 family RNA polymerase sigma factor [Alicyclobacillus sp.]